MGEMHCAKRFFSARVQGDSLPYPMATTGQLGEHCVARLLEERGWRILLRNWRDRYGEVDLVARDLSGGLHLIEVKTTRSRGGRVPLEERITPRQIARLRQASLRLPLTEPFTTLHLDAALVRLDTSTAHITYLPDCHG